MIFLVEEMKNYMRSVDEENSYRFFFLLVFVYVGFDFIDFRNLFIVFLKDDQVNIEDENGFFFFRLEEVYLGSLESFGFLIFFLVQVLLVIFESFSLLFFFLVQVLVVIGESLSDFSVILEQFLYSYGIRFNGFKIDDSIIFIEIRNRVEVYGRVEFRDLEDFEESFSLDENYSYGFSGRYLFVYGRRYVREVRFNFDEIRIVFDDIKVESGCFDFKYDVVSIWSFNVDDFMGFE